MKQVLGRKVGGFFRRVELERRALEPGVAEQQVAAAPLTLADGEPPHDETAPRRDLEHPVLRPAADRAARSERKSPNRGGTKKKPVGDRAGGATRPRGGNRRGKTGKA